MNFDVKGRQEMLSTYTHRSARPTDISLCTYMLLNSSIHQVVFDAPSHQAVSDWLSCIDVIYGNAHFQSVYTLTDASHSVLPPLAYATHLSEQWMLKQFNRMRSRNAILHADGPLNPLAEQITHALPGYGNNLLRFFAPHERSEAIRWLVSDD
jgi:hypothetical protein